MSRWDSAAANLDLDINVAPGRVRIGADLVMCFLHESGEFGLGQAAILDVELYGEAKAPTLAGTYRDLGGDTRLAGILFVLLADEVESATKAGSIASCEQVFRGRRPRPPRSTHGLRHRKIDANAAIFGLGVAIAAARCGRAGREERLDLVHKKPLTHSRGVIVHCAGPRRRKQTRRRSGPAADRTAAEAER